MGDVIKMEQELQQLNDKLRKTEEQYQYKVDELRQTITKLQRNSGGGGGGGGNGKEEVSAENWERIKKLEREKAELLSRANEAEEELKTINDYYQKEIKKYKKIITKLKQELEKHKKS